MTPLSAAQQTDALASLLSSRLREVREDLVRRWLERIVARVSLSPARVFPTEELLNHVPLLIDGIADYLENPHDELGAEAPVVAKAMELGALRHVQGFDAYEILKEHEILGGVIFAFLTTQLDDAELPGSRRDLAICWQRVASAVELIRQATMTHFLRLLAERTNEREGRLRRFNRMVSHELKNRVGAIRGASSLLAEPWIETQERERFVRMVHDNAEGLQRVLNDLEALSRIDTDTRQRRNVLLPQAATESVRQLRDVAQSRGVIVHVSDDLPNVEVDAAAVELALVNYLSNAIKYSNPASEDRWVKVLGELQFGAHSDGGAELVVRVIDNGIGVPAAARERLFEQFFRAHRDSASTVEGTGLGLSIVRETVDSMGGRAWAEFPETGETVFAFSLPSRRAEDAAAAGTKRAE
ncbi:MAG TPA: sensor histidine kinase [Gemmatimonadaceae bacterium]|nr:sensor histidine kinase [Gemmatimonadaceae bacterium]